MTRFLRLCAVGLAAISVMAIAGTVFADRASLAALAVSWPVPYVVVGALLTYRRPRLLTGWLFAVVAFLVSSGAIAEHLAERGLAMMPAPWWGVLSAWYGEWYWVVLIYTTLIFLPLLFPDGTAPTPRLHRITWSITGVFAVIVVTAALQGRLDTPAGRFVANPVGIAGLGDIEEGVLAPVMILLTGAFLITAFAGLIVRFRRSRGVERQQLKLFTFAGIAMITLFVLGAVTETVIGRRYEIVDLVGFAAPPVAAAVAIFRYRLYAIDRFISRTVTYALVTALLVGVYVSAVAVMSAALDPLAGESPFAVAAATLLAAAAFRPARRRIQHAVDRRFNRARYDAEHTLDDFRERVRSDVDLDRLCADLVAVADDTFEPRATTVWLRPEEAT